MGGGGGGGGGGESSFSKLGIALTVIFVVALLALFAQLLYILWRRRVFGRETYTGGGAREGADHLSIYSSSESSFSSKELLYFFCMRPHSSSNTVTNSNDNRNSNRQVDVELVDIDLLKLQGMFGPPRFLFTIKEEEREGFESPADKSLYSADKAAKKIDEFSRNANKVSLEECFNAADSAVEIEVDGGGDDATPFSTPCASPAFFTPSSSPVQNDANFRIMEDGGICSESKRRR